MIIKPFVLSFSFALFIGTAAAQSPTGPIVNGRHLQPTAQQVESREGDRARERDARAQPDIDQLYDQILRAATRQRR